MDEYTEQTTVGLGSRLWQSIKGMAFGLLLFVAAFPVLWLNEGHAVKTARSLAQGAKVVIDVPADRVDAANEGKLVHLAGRVTTDETVTDPMFGVSARAIRLRRKVEMYQWQETSSSQKRKNLGGSETTTTTYRYALVWSEQPINSGGFKQPEGHLNPAMPFTSAEYVAGNVKLGAFTLGGDIVGRLKGEDPVDVSGAKLSESVPAGARPVESGFAFGNPGSPQLGDLRVSFQQLKPTDGSIVARQFQNTLAPYRAPAGGTIELVAMGLLPADTMFADAQSSNTVFTWVLRGVGFLLMFIGLALLLNPLATFGDVVPLVGGLMRAGVALIAGLLALCLSLVTIALAWIAHRPLLGIALLAGAALFAYLMAKFRGRKVRQLRAKAASAR